LNAHVEIYTSLLGTEFKSRRLTSSEASIAHIPKFRKIRQSRARSVIEQVNGKLHGSVIELVNGKMHSICHLGATK